MIIYKLSDTSIKIGGVGKYAEMIVDFMVSKKHTISEKSSSVFIKLKEEEKLEKKRIFE